MYSELAGDIVFHVAGAPNTIYCIDMTTGLVCWWRNGERNGILGSTTYTLGAVNEFFSKGVWVILEDRRIKTLIKKSIEKFVL